MLHATIKRDPFSKKKHLPRETYSHAQPNEYKSLLRDLICDKDSSLFT